MSRYQDHEYEVAIVGAGPYGLAAAAHLRSAGLETRVFGDPMVFWRTQMPSGMLLRSSWEASHISDPRGEFTLDRYQVAQGVQLPTPIPLERFVEYGGWFQRQVAPDLDQRRVKQIRPQADQLSLELEDGETFRARRVVVAGGIAPFAWRPPQFADLPASLVSHSSDHADLTRFSGQRVVVVGGGQSAFESAALLSEGGAEVELIMRAKRVRWLGHNSWLRRRPAPLRYVFYPPTDVGPPGLNLLVHMPDLFRRLPRGLQARVAYRSIRPAASNWLQPRTRGVRITAGRSVLAATMERDQARLQLDDGSERRVNHLLLATGFRVDVSRYPFLSPEVVRMLNCVEGYPLLRTGFESSVPGLHFLGAPAAWSFGPLMRFVSGTHYAAHAVTRHILGQARGERGDRYDPRWRHAA